MALRAAIVEPKAIDAIFRAAWQKNMDIGDPTGRRRKAAVGMEMEMEMDNDGAGAGLCC